MARRILGGAALAAASLTAHAGFALTAQEAWDGWKAFASDAGQSISTESEATTGGRLTVTGLTFTSEIEGTTITGTMDEMVFSENGDGTVAITLADTYPVTVSGISDIDEKIEAVIGVAMPGAVITASEAGSAVSYSYAAPETTVTLDSLVVDDETIPFEMIVALADLAGSYTGANEGEPASQAVTIGTLTIDMDADVPEDNVNFTLDLSMADIASEGTGSAMMLYAGADMAEMLKDGFSTDTRGSGGATSVEIDFADDRESFQLSATMDGYTSRFALSADVMDVEQTANNFAFTASGSEIPLPRVTGTLGEWTTNFGLPLSASDTAEPFDVRVVLGDLVLGEEIWSMVDPAGALPRDPATLVLDMVGSVKLLVSLFDEEQLATADMPGELEALTLNEVLLRLAGAELTGTGAFTFDNTRTAFNGFPAPDGTVNLQVVGANGLIDRLVQMGLIQEQQVMMARMMIGMLATPGDGPDTLISEITVRPDGSILANGAPLPF